METSRSQWQVLLIGGGSGVGKSTVAADIAKTLQISHLLVDDLRMAIQAVTTPQQQPELHYFLTTPNPARLSVDEFVTGLIRVGRALLPALREVISHHVAVPAAGRLIMEGDGLLPELVRGLTLSDVHGAPLLDGATQVRAVFLYEDDEAHLLRNFLQRDRGFTEGAEAEQRHYVHLAWCYGQWVKAEAERYRLPVIRAQPFATLAQRIRAAVENSP